jgi:hypothetical protein
VFGRCHAVVPKVVTSVGDPRPLPHLPPSSKDEKAPGNDEDDEEEVPDSDRVREELVHADS